MKQNKFLAVLLLLKLTSINGCGAVDDASTLDVTDINRADQALELDGMVLHDTCGGIVEDGCSSCIDQASRAQSDCRSACNNQAAISGNFAFNCADSCGSTPPREICAYTCDKPKQEPQCSHRAFEFELTTQTDKQVRDACEAAVVRDKDCGEVRVGANCELYGRVESPGVVQTYECLTQQSCALDAEPCLEKLPPSTLVEDLAAVCDAEIESSLQDRLTAQGPWVRPQLRDNALVCGERYCGTQDYQRCITAWLNATVGN